MDFETFLADSVLRPRLERQGALVIYDPDDRYADLAADLASPEKVALVDGRTSIIEAREAAMDAWKGVGEDEAHQQRLVIYLPRERRLGENDLREDPFAAIALGAAAFPDGQGDIYEALCQQFLPDQVAQIEELFREEEPSFGMVNALAGKTTPAPILCEILGGDGPREILFRFLSLTEQAEKRLRDTAGWVRELKRLVKSTLDLDLDGKARDVAKLRHQLWRYLLFSEFAADLPSGLPESLEGIPKAGPMHVAFANSLCEQLRDSISSETAYEDYANQVAQELQLEERCAGIDNLGRRDTFAFESRSFLRQFARSISAGRHEEAGTILEERERNSFWNRDGERALEWRVAKLCLELSTHLEEAARYRKKTPASDLAGWIEHYTADFHQIDRLHRLVEQSYLDLRGSDSALEPLVLELRSRYREEADHLARSFQGRVSEEGWPAGGLLRSTEIFDQLVHARWQDGERVALFMVDALRYELATELLSLLKRQHRPTLSTVAGHLPSITIVGMAALVPDSAGMELKDVKGKLVPEISGKRIDGPSARFAAIAAKVGEQRCRLLDLEDAVKPTLAQALEGIEIAVIKTTDIDTIGEASVPQAMTQLGAVLREIGIAAKKLADAGFRRAIIATDHGFVWIPAPDAGDSTKAPAGDWIQCKERCLLGSGQSSEGTLRFEAQALGIRGEVESVVVPKGLATFSKGVSYFHEGISPQECVTPVIDTVLVPSETGSAAVEKPEPILSYRGGKTAKITTLLPMIEISIPQGDMFAAEPVKFLLEAVAGKKQVVGEVGASQYVDTSTRTVSLNPGSAIKVPVRMDEAFEGKFQVVARDPETGAVLAKIELQTDYHQ